MTQGAPEPSYFPSAVTTDSEADHNLRKQSRINLDNDSVERLIARRSSSLVFSPWPRIVMSSIIRRRSGLMRSVVIGMLLS